MPADDLSLRRDAVFGAALALALAAIAVVWREPSYMTDRDIYQEIGRHLVIPDCSSLHCTRVLVAGILEHLPGPSLVKWKLYAVLANTIAAMGVLRLCRWFGLSGGVGRLAAVFVAFGRGSQLTLFDPYTSDPFIYALTPWMTFWLADGRVALAAAVALIGVFGKEFAAGPLWVFAMYGALERRRDVLVKTGLAALAVSFIWLVFQLALALRFNYSYGGNPSSQLQAGGYLAAWIRSLGWFHAIASLVLHLGPILLLAAAGYRRAPHLLRGLALASVPAAIVLCYVQQPDRALWNFEWVIVPLAAMLCAGQPGWLIASFVVSYAVVNLPAFPDQTVGVLAVPFLLCLTSTILIIRNASRGRAGVERAIPESPAAALRYATVAIAVVFVLVVAAGALAADITIHRSIESNFGVNVWGYRGAVARRKQPGEVRVVVLGGRQVFGRRVEGSIPALLDLYLNIPWMRTNQHYMGTAPMSAINLATPFDRLTTFRQTLQDFENLDYDIACLYIGHDDPAPSVDAAKTGWRHQSSVYAMTRYLPVFPSVWALRYAGAPNAEGSGSDTDPDDYRANLQATIDYVLSRRRMVLVATNPSVEGGEARRQDDVGQWLRERYGSNRSFRYQDLRPVVDVESHSLDGFIAESLSQNVFGLLNQQ